MAFGSRKSSFGRSKRRPSEPEDRKKNRLFVGAGQISQVEYQKTNPDRVNIFLDGEYAFSLAAIMAAERKLKAGVTLSAEEVAELQEADFYNKGLAASLQLLALRPRSEAEISTNLRKRYPEATPETICRVVERLRELNYLNDESFAKFWVENRTTFSPRGRNLLRQELLQKRVPRDIIEAVIESYLDTQAEDDEAEDEESGGLSVEESQALEMARKKAHSYAAEQWPAFYRKLGGFLLRRGYDYGITGRVTRQVWQELKGQEVSEEEEEE